MQDSTRDAKLIGTALGTFNVALLTLLLVLWLHLAGELGDILDDLNTAVGLAIFGLLWAVTCYCTYRGLTQASPQLGRPMPLRRLLSSAQAWGAWNGMIFFWAALLGLLIGIVITALFEGDAGSAASILIFGIIAFVMGTVASAAVGSLFGVVFGLIDAGVLRLAQAVAGRPADDMKQPG